MVLQLQLPFNVLFIQLHYCLSYILCLSCQVQLCSSHFLDVNLSNSCPKECQRHILSILQNILWCVCPCYKWTIKSCASAIVDLMTCHCFYLQLSSYDLECASLLPAEFSLPFSSGNQESKITSILKQEFGILAVEGICSKSYCQ